jgi:glycosyltransferase involved in cell wall biosynthesis
MRVALVIPAWQEAESIGAVLDEVPAGCVDATLVVVGAADDPTLAVARDHGATALVQSRPGYGAACWEGALAALAAGADVVAFLDGDYADPPMALPRVLGPLLRREADLVLGCRAGAGLPLHARLGNRLVCALMRLLLGARPSGIPSDLPSFKAIRAEALIGLDMRERGYGWTVEMLAKAVRAGLRISQTDVAYRSRLGGRSKVSGTVRGSLGAAWRLCLCAIRYARWRPPGAPVPAPRHADG